MTRALCQLISGMDSTSLKFPAYRAWLVDVRRKANVKNASKTLLADYLDPPSESSRVNQLAVGFDIGATIIPNHLDQCHA